MKKAKAVALLSAMAWSLGTWGGCSKRARSPDEALPPMLDPAEQAGREQARFEFECDEAISLRRSASGQEGDTSWYDFVATGCQRSAEYRATCILNECRAERVSAVRVVPGRSLKQVGERHDGTH